MKWVMAFLACTSSSTYTKVAKIMNLTHIRIGMVYQKMDNLIITENDKTYCLHIKTIRRFGDHAHREHWTSQQWIGAIAQDSANIKYGIKH